MPTKVQAKSLSRTKNSFATRKMDSYGISHTTISERNLGLMYACVAVVQHSGLRPRVGENSLEATVLPFLPKAPGVRDVRRDLGPMMMAYGERVMRTLPTPTEA